jgi:hypothetical protein
LAHAAVHAQGSVGSPKAARAPSGSAWRRAWAGRAGRTCASAAPPRCRPPPPPAQSNPRAHLSQSPSRAPAPAPARCFNPLHGNTRNQHTARQHIFCTGMHPENIIVLPLESGLPQA